VQGCELGEPSMFSSTEQFAPPHTPRALDERER